MMDNQFRQHPLVVSESDLIGCSCDGEHPIPTATIYSGADACEVLAEDCSALYGVQPVLLISDPETDLVAGKSLLAALQQRQVNLEHHPLDTNPSATDTLVEKIQLASRDKVLIISVGSGTINDLGKFAADRSVDEWLHLKHRCDQGQRGQADLACGTAETNLCYPASDSAGTAEAASGRVL